MVLQLSCPTTFLPKDPNPMSATLKSPSPRGAQKVLVPPHGPQRSLWSGTLEKLSLEPPLPPHQPLYRPTPVQRPLRGAQPLVWEGRLCKTPRTTSWHRTWNSSVVWSRCHPRHSSTGYVSCFPSLARSLSPDGPAQPSLCSTHGPSPVTCSALPDVAWAGARSLGPDALVADGRNPTEMEPKEKTLLAHMTEKCRKADGKPTGPGDSHTTFRALITSAYRLCVDMQAFPKEREHSSPRTQSDHHLTKNV